MHAGVQGCVCDQATSSTLQALPTTTVPQLVKTCASFLPPNDMIMLEVLRNKPSTRSTVTLIFRGPF